MKTFKQLITEWSDAEKFWREKGKGTFSQILANLKNSNAEAFSNADVTMWTFPDKSEIEQYKGNFRVVEYWY